MSNQQPLSTCSNIAENESGAVPVVSVIIVSWNCHALLRDCVTSIFAETPDLAIEVIVVDNASVDNTVNLLGAEFPAVKVIANTDNRGFAAANNQGLAIARGRYLLLLNPDTLILDRAIQKTLAFAETHPDIGVVGPQVFEDERTLQRTCFSFPTPWRLMLMETGLYRLAPRSKLLGQHELGWWDRDTQLDVDVVSGMYMLVRREAFEAVGPMDEAFFVYAEEADWCLRFHQAGWRCVFTPKARIIHRDGGSKSTAQVSVRMYVQMQKSLLIFQRKHYGRLAGLVVRTLYIASTITRSVVFGLAGILRLCPTASEHLKRYRAGLRFHFKNIGP